MAELDDIFGGEKEQPTGPHEQSGEWAIPPAVEAEPNKQTFDRQGLPWWAKLAFVAIVLFVVIRVANMSNDRQDERHHEDGGAVIVADSVLVLVVHESGDRGRELSILMRYKPWLEKLESNDVDFQVVDHDRKSGEIAPYVEAANQVRDGSSLLLIVDGKVVVNEPFPQEKSDEVIDQLLKKHAGK